MAMQSHQTVQQIILYNVQCTINEYITIYMYSIEVYSITYCLSINCTASLNECEYCYSSQ